MALTFVSLGSIIGSGWPLSPLTAAVSAGGSSIVSWLLAGVIIGLLALVHAELGAAYPLTGGTARWPGLAFGSLGGFTAGWAGWLGTVTLGPIEVEAALSYLNNKWPKLINDVGGALTPTGLAVATVLMLLFTVINVLGVRWLAGMNTITVLWKIAVPLTTVIALMWISFQGSNFTAGGGFAPTAPMECSRLCPWVLCSRCRALNKRRM
jgi:amino acid transporter